MRLFLLLALKRNVTLIDMLFGVDSGLGKLTIWIYLIGFVFKIELFIDLAVVVHNFIHGQYLIVEVQEIFKVMPNCTAPIFIDDTYAVIKHIPQTPIMFNMAISFNVSWLATF